LELTVIPTGETITISFWFSGTRYQLTSIEFEDGGVLLPNDFVAFSPTPTSIFNSNVNNIDDLNTILVIQQVAMPATFEVKELTHIAINSNNSLFSTVNMFSVTPTTMQNDKPFSS
jgi:hypothetical protein